MKRLVCCLDGTWNSDEDGSILTNVVKLHRAILPRDANGIQQVSHYVKGIVSAKGTRAQFLKGAVGYEVGDRIREGYRVLSDAYQPGDEIFLFGFSRGAFEARSLAGFITLFGIARKDAGFNVDDAWAFYRQSPGRRSAAALEKIRSAACYPVRIKCVGVWDTVGNIGNPFFSSGLLGRWSKFHDTRLHPSIDVGLHALSIDEKRGPFRPSLWTRPRNAAPTPNQHVEQVWFAGSHADVGGGFPETELSDIALLWMAERASATAGLAVDTDQLKRTTKPNPLGLQHASATGGIFKWSGRFPFIRLINQRTQAIPRLRRMLIGAWRSSKIVRAELSVNESVHDSARARFGKTVNEANGEKLNAIVYRPCNLAALIAARQGPETEGANMTDAAGKAMNGAAQAPADGASATLKLVTVHGTGAGDKECTGERWWQRGSPFLTELAKRLNLDPSRVEIVPFHWELGPNSETGRRTASKALYERLKGYDKLGTDYHVIGHSHGGSVIYDALLYSVARGKPFERLKSWCTIGTPFLDYRANRFLFSRLGTKGLTLYAMAIGVICFGAGLLIYYWTSNTQVSAEPGRFFFELVLPIALIALGFGGACLAFLYSVERIRGDTHPQDRKKKTAELYRDRWFGLWHHDDEAISALSNVRFVKGAIVPSTFLEPFVAIAQVLATVLLSVALVILVLPDFWSFMVSSWTTIMHEDSGSVLGYVMLISAAIAALAVVAALYIGIGSAIAAAFKLLARAVGWPLSKAIDNLVWSSVRQQAWGDDRQGESVSQVGSHPPEFAATFDPLPAAVADEVSRFSEKHAILTLTKVREVLGMTRNPKSSPDMRAQLSEQLNWRELIHTTYFEIPQFADLAAFGLHRAGLAPLKEDFWPSARRDQAQKWFSAISTPSSGAPAAANAVKAASTP